MVCLGKGDSGLGESPGLAARKLVSPSGSNPTWSPDSAAIALGHDGEGGIVVVNLEDLSRKRIADAGKDPAWSPDNQWIAFDRSASKDPGIEIIDVQAATAQGRSEADVAAATVRLPLQYLVVECPRQIYQPRQKEMDSFFQYADRNVPVAEEILGVKAGRRIVVRIEESEKTGCRCTGDIIYVSSRCLIEAPLRRWMHVAFPHEVVHWFLGVKVTPHFPAWFVEPPATFVGYEVARRLGQKEIADDDEAKFLRWAEDYQKRGLKTVWLERFPPDADNESRGMAYRILQTLVQRHGWELFGKFLNALLADRVNFAVISDVQEKQQVMIRYLSQAAGKDLTRDFQNWGFVGKTRE